MKRYLLILACISGTTFRVTRSAVKSLSAVQHIDYYGEVSGNYLIRWEFQKYCDFFYDPRTIKKNFPTVPNEGITFDPAQVRSGDIVFVRDPASFFKDIHPKITCPYIILAHGQSFDALPYECVSYLDDPTIIAYFTVHLPDLPHPKMIPLPAGVMQSKALYEKKDEMSALFTSLRRTSSKKHMLYCNFLNRTHESREELKDYFSEKPYCYRSKRCKFDKYIHDVAESKFVLSPPGKAMDANRTWEALLVGSIPIVISSQLNPLYEGLPVLVVEDWFDITQEFLEEKYAEFTSKSYNLEKLYVEYWLKKIEKVRQDFLANS